MLYLSKIKYFPLPKIQQKKFMTLGGNIYNTRMENEKTNKNKNLI